MIFVIILFLTADCIANNVTEFQLNETAKRYLYEYGYLYTEDNSSLQLINETVFSNALLIFQEYYKLPTDGKLNNETRKLMAKPRCGNSDIISDYRLSSYKWNKPVVTWHYYLAKPSVLKLTEKAFTLWEEKSGIRFVHNRTYADILVSNKRLKHMMQKESWQCSREFDGKGGQLAHAYFPDYNNSRREIHIDEDESWSYLIDGTNSLGETSLFATLIHEIGHAIGLSHSDTPDSVMFAFYNGRVELGDDDVLAIQNVYGKHQSTSAIPLIPTSQPPNFVPSEEEEDDDYPIDTSQIDLCNFKNLNMFLIANKRLYVLHDKWLWILNSNDMSYSKPTIITDWLKFIPKNFSKIIAVYQRPSGEIVMFIDSLIYMFDIASLTLNYGYPRHIQSVFNIQPNNLHAVFNSYSGKTFIFHDDNYYREVNECTFTTKSWGYISDLFAGIPPKIDSSFRFTDGNLYFFKNNTVYVFNEFRGELVKTEKFNLSLFGMECVNEQILLQLKDLILKLLVQRK